MKELVKILCFDKLLSWNYSHDEKISLVIAAIIAVALTVSCTI